MKAILFGGTGFFGGSILRKLSSEGPIEHVVLASRSADSASKAGSAAAVPTSSVVFDINDRNALFTAVAEADLVLNAAGNATQTAPRIIRAALEASRPYVDLSAEVDVLISAERMIEELGAPDVPIILGSGVHPGMTELLGARAMSELDHVSRVDMYLLATLQDYGRADDFIPMFQSGWNGINGLQTFCKFPGMTAVMASGRSRKFIKPADAVLEFKTLDGVKLKGFALATAEPLTLSRFSGGTIDVTMSMSFWPPAANEIARAAAPGFLRNDNDFAPVFASMWETVSEETRAHPKCHFWATASGRKDGVPRSATVFSRQNWANQPGSVKTTVGVFVHSAGAIARGDIKKTGLLAPVELFSPEEVFAGLAAPGEPEIEVLIS